MTEPLGLVLLVDDSAADNFIHRRILKKNKLALDVRDFLYAADALEFLRKTDRSPIDLILLDINMPRMDGFEFADAYHQLIPEAKAKAVIVMITASLDPADEKRANEHPAIHGFVVKPINAANLTATVEEIALR